jgi:regulator of nucleoside diphosphate kinase
MTVARKPAKQPKLIISATDADRLSVLATRMEQSSPVVSNLLLDEIERAEIRPDQRVPQNVVGMNATVQFIDEAHDTQRTVQLVYPAEADIAAGRISVLTPVGAGLIGLSEGQSIQWPDREGHTRILKILKVERPQEPAT